MYRPSPLALLSLPLLLAACAGQPPASPVSRGGQLEMNLASGAYNCELGVHLRVEREVRERVNQRIVLVWNGASYRLERNFSYSGLPRFEDAGSGLVWIDLPWKGMLLDGRSNKPLANECRAAA